MSEEQKSPITRFVEWIDSRFGFSNTILRPGPKYTFTPTYWLGGLAFLVFMLQGVTGAILLMFYTPSTDAAYELTSKMISSVPFGALLQTVHLYGGYAMIILALIHFLRCYFEGVYKKPRELMWMVGMLMGLCTLFMGFTGYILPWTVISGCAAHISLGIIDYLPPQIAGPLKTAIIGIGTDEEILRRFCAYHVVILPAAIFLLFLIKLHMFEVHGPAEPVTPKHHLPDDAFERRPWFPDVLVYLLMQGLVFIAVLLLISALFPLVLPPKFSMEAAASVHPEPEWYFMWMYTLLRINIFSGTTGVLAVMGMVGIIGLIIFFLPFVDRSEARHPLERPVATTLGLIGIAEFIILIVWGYMTPGENLPTEQAVLVLGLPALIIALVCKYYFDRILVERGIRTPKKFAFEFLNFIAKRKYLSIVVFSFLVSMTACTAAGVVSDAAYGNVLSAMVGTVFTGALFFLAFALMYLTDKAASIPMKRKFSPLEMGGE